MAKPPCPIESPHRIFGHIALQLRLADTAPVCDADSIV
jgi:hypothetical protein